jgi:hypothetical protein
MNAVAKFTAFAAKVIPCHFKLWTICITASTLTPNCMFAPIFQLCMFAPCFLKLTKWIVPALSRIGEGVSPVLKSQPCPNMELFWYGETYVLSK